MKTLKPSLARHIDNLDTLKQSIIISLISFLLSMMLHILFFWVYHKYSGVRRLVPQFLKAENQKTKIPMKPVVRLGTAGHTNLTMNAGKHSDDKKIVFDEVTLCNILSFSKELRRQIQREDDTSSVKSAITC